jgi:hypothetical protein
MAARPAVLAPWRRVRAKSLLQCGRVSAQLTLSQSGAVKSLSSSRTPWAVMSSPI